jgi:hypothetical protein
MVTIIQNQYYKKIVLLIQKKWYYSTYTNSHSQIVTKYFTGIWFNIKKKKF